jgi:hypothetical protein
MAYKRKQPMVVIVHHALYVLFYLHSVIFIPALHATLLPLPCLWVSWLLLYVRCWVGLSS